MTGARFATDTSSSSYEFAAEELVILSRARPLRLRSLEPAGVGALRKLFGRGDLQLADGAGLTWRFLWLARGEPRRQVILRGQGTQLLLGVVEDGLRKSLGSREWWDYDQDSSLLAWTLAHTALLDSLGRLLSESLLPDGWREPAEPPDASAMSLEFSVCNAGEKVASGELSLQSNTLTKLGAAAAAAAPGAASDLGPWAGRLRAELRVVLPRIGFPGEELDAARGGDVLVLGPRARCWAGLELLYPARLAPARSAGPGGLRAWRVCYDQGRIEVAAISLEDSTRTFMSQPISDQPAGGAPVSSLASVPVTLDFDLGSLAVPLGELAAIKPGYVFELPGRLEQARVIIRANGTPIGTGELVSVGDTLGVQLLSIDPNGLR